VRGLNCPRPIKNWTQAGLSQKVLDVLIKSALEKPLPIQAQALPIIMSGRDCIGIAKTGSGKTLAFVLPMLRHVKDQPPLAHGDGPIALIMAPTRELVVQIAKVREGLQRSGTPWAGQVEAQAALGHGTNVSVELDGDGARSKQDGVHMLLLLRLCGRSAHWHMCMLPLVAMVASGWPL
jgi:hypothetical protein